jgi:hypothetical protein
MHGVNRLAAASMLASLMVASAADADEPRPAGAKPPDLPTCVHAYEQAQMLRQAGKLRAARDQLLVCVRDSCPAVARQDCTTWLDAVEASLPTIAVSVLDAQGAAALDAAVTIDGAAVTDWGSGRAIAVDPGRHEVRASRAGGPPATATVLVVEGQRNQPLVLTLPGAAAAPPPPTGDADDAGAPVAPWIFAGVALLGAGGFAGFGVAALSRESELDETCKPNCGDQVDDVRTLRIVSGVSLGVGIAGAAGLALSLLLSGDEAPVGHATPTGKRSRLMPWSAGDVAGVAVPF